MNKGFKYPDLPEKLYDFRVFLIYVWRGLGLPDPTPLQIDIADWLQKGGRRKVIEAFRGVGKSWITSAYVMWQLRLDPSKKFLVISAGKERADNFTTFCIRLMDEINILHCMRTNKSRRNSKVSFDVAGVTPDHAPSVKSIGIFGQLTGTRADEIIADDIETPTNSLTQSSRDRLSEAVKEFDAIIKPNGRITYLGTPQTEQSIYNQLQSRGYSLRVWTAKFPLQNKLKNYNNSLAPKIISALKSNPALSGQPADPKRFSLEDLEERELSYGKSGFALQFMLDTSLSDADRYPLKLSDLIVADIKEETAPEIITWGNSSSESITSLPSVGFNGDSYFAPKFMSDKRVEYRQRIMAIDPSGRGKDETGFVILYERDGYLYLMESGGINGGYSSNVLETLAQKAKKYKVNAIIIESNFGDGMFKELLSPVLLKAGVKAYVEDVRHSCMKEARIIDTLEPVLSNHRLIVKTNVIIDDFHNIGSTPSDSKHRYMLFYQMTHITRDKGALTHDDRLDALSMAVAHFTESMRQDADIKAQRRKERILNAELKDFTTKPVLRRDKELLTALGMTPAFRTIAKDGKECFPNTPSQFKRDIRNRR